MTVHRLGHMDDTVRDLARDVPAYRELLMRIPEPLLVELDELIVNRVHEGDLPGGAAALESEREAHITLAIRSLVDCWPLLPAPYAGAEGERKGPHASEEAS